MDVFRHHLGCEAKKSVLAVDWFQLKFELLASFSSNADRVFANTTLLEKRLRQVISGSPYSFSFLDRHALNGSWQNFVHRSMCMHRKHLNALHSLQDECPFGVATVLLAWHVVATSSFTSLKSLIAKSAIECLQHGLRIFQHTASLVHVLLSGWIIPKLMSMLLSFLVPGPGSHSGCVSASASSACVERLRICRSEQELFDGSSTRGSEARECLWWALDPLLQLHTLSALGDIFTCSPSDLLTLDALQMSLIGLPSNSKRSAQEGSLGAPFGAWVKWLPDFYLQAKLVDDYLFECESSMNAHIWKFENSTGSIFQRGLQHNTAWVVLLYSTGNSSASIDYWWLQAMTVLMWSIRRVHRAERPFLVLCETSTHLALQRRLRDLGFVVILVEIPEMHGDLAIELGCTFTSCRQSLMKVHLWRMLEFERLVYIDADSLVLRSLEELFNLPADIHFAASTRKHPSNAWLFESSVMMVTPDIGIYRGMLHRLSHGSMFESTTSQNDISSLGGDTRFFNIFWQQSIDHSLDCASLFNSSSVLPRQNFSTPTMCLLDIGFNTPVSFPLVAFALEHGLLQSWCNPTNGVRVMHWPGKDWKPWDRRGGDPWSFSAADEMWWEAFGAVQNMTKEVQLPSGWRDDNRCGKNHMHVSGTEGQCNPSGVFPCCNPSAGWCGNSDAHCLCRTCLDYSAKLRNTFRFNIANPRAVGVAVLILARMDTFANLRKLARLLRGLGTCPWIVARGMQIRILHDSLLYEPCAHSFHSGDCVDALGDWGANVQLINISKYFIPPEEFQGVKDVKGFPLSYAVMCQFWASAVFEVPFVRELRYFLRLDADATISCSSNAPDPFAVMEAQGANYGYYVLGRDEEYVSSGFTSHLKTYVNSERFSKGITNTSYTSDESLDAIASAPMFYSNFEAIDVSFFRSVAVQRYTSDVLSSKGIYLHRWGDAIIRYGQLLAGVGKAVCFDGAYGYCHGDCCMVGIGSCSYPRGSCHGLGNDGKLLDLHFFPSRADV